MRILSIILISVTAGSFCSCSILSGKEVARLAINEVSRETLIRKEATVDLKLGDEIVFWSEMDFEYQGNVKLRFKLNIMKDGKPYGNLEIDPTVKDLTFGESRLTEKDKTRWRFSGQNIIFNVAEDGQYTFSGVLVASENESLIIHKAELVLKSI